MSQDMTSKPETSEQFYSPKSIETWSVESDADRLMDELFSDLDRMLEGGAKLNNDSPSPNYVSIESVVVPAVVMPTIKPQGGSLVPQSLNTQTRTQVLPPKMKTKPSSPKNSGLDKILFVLASLGLVSAIAWLTTTKKLNLPVNFNWLPTFDGSSNEPVSETDLQFVAYLQRSLELVDRKQESNQESPGNTASNQVSVTLPPAPPPANTASNPAPQSSVIERIYIPVYPPTQQTQPVAPVAPVTPVAPTPNLTLPPPPSIAVPSPLPEPSPTQNQAVDPNLQSTLNLPVVKHTLVGLLESGENSAALFEIDGSSHRIRIGEAIGTSGWILVSVADQKAVIRRSGEVRSIYVGQEF
jgi:hypothetical protein